MIAILLSTFNGEKYLRELLDSLFTQTYKDFILIIRDDGSIDGTVYILEEYKKKHKNIILLDNRENKGVIGSFSYLLEYAVHNTNCDYFMFCDQDDVWKENKIEITLNKMQEIEKQKGKGIPILIHTDLEVVDENLNLISKSFWKYCSISPKLNSFNRLLVQNTVTGCTVMINRVLATISIPIPKGVIMHDWWLGLVAAKFGVIEFLKHPTIKYRQHENNDTGAESYRKVFLKNIVKVVRKVLLRENVIFVEYEGCIHQAKLFLDRYKDRLDSNSKEMLNSFVFIKNKSFFHKRKIILKYKILKQGFFKNIGFLLIL